MAPSTSAVSGRKNTLLAKPSRMGFLDLPGEVRNEIYKHLFASGFTVELLGQGSQSSAKQNKPIILCVGSINATNALFKAQNYDKPTQRNFQPILRVSRELGHYNRVEGFNTKWATSLCALLLVCKQVHGEIRQLLYQATTFVFAAPKRLRNFLSVIPKRDLRSIRTLHLQYASYGNPHLAGLDAFKAKHTAAWTKICKLASTRMVNLETLHFDMHITDTPLHFTLQEQWLQPLAQFRRLVGRPGDRAQNGSLKNIEIVLSTFYTKGSLVWFRGQLAEACADLHALFAEAVRRRMLGWSEEDALVEYKEAWEGKHRRWRNHLRFSVMQ